MKLTTKEHIEEFLKIVDECSGEVFLTSVMGDMFNLKSEISRFVIASIFITGKGDHLELFCANAFDESKFIEYFNKHPEVL